ncbi:MAG TPA: isoleucine--tRNA ligase [Candidatus Krumholzibacteria bacterium]|nr:isoleucine--tRNA ligase [Candidatus Krumholzibacteria bacterium]
MPFRKVTSKVEFAALEEEINQAWERERTFQRSIEQRAGGPEYVFYDGPPFATGLPHYGHLLAGTIKDVVPRYRSMRGAIVERRFGWDCHGLPVEYEMEKELELRSRRDIESYGIARFNEACRSIVLRYVGEWRKTVRRMGRWVDFDNDYKTMDPDYMESIWWAFQRLWEQGLIYQGFKVMPYCPRCATPLSNFETAQGYEDVQDPAITVRFRASAAAASALGAEKPLSFLAWTTTPWTLPSNLGLAVGADIPYVRVRDGEQEYILAAERVAAHWKDPASLEVRATFPGQALDGLEYEPLFPYFTALAAQGAFRVRLGDFVSTAEGTGIVHVAPGFGEDDYALGQKHGIPVVCPVDAEGRFTAEVPDYAGKFVKDADADIMRRLRDEKRLLHRTTLQHSYPHCYRCDSVLIYRAITTWFVRIDTIKERMLACNARIHWVPEHLRDGRFGQWLANARDWAISRNRYWGTPLPVWRCEGCGADLCLGSRAELEKLSGQRLTDLHKHFVDAVTVPCAECGGVCRRIPEVLDCWFESGSMPYAQNHYPFENKERFEANFPAQFIAEGLDQTRGWFYTLLVLSTALFDQPAFEHVVVNGLVLAADGKKMSKRLKNYPEPDAVIDLYGADALRLYLMNSAVVRGENLRFSEDGVREVLRTILLPLWNAYSFFVTYANVDGWEPASLERPAASSRRHQLDRWILSASERLLRQATAAMEEYELQRAIDPIVQFVDELTNWYIRRSRRRFWKSENDEDKLQAYETLYAVLLHTCHVLAPYTPFIADAMYRNLVGPLLARGAAVADSVHLRDWPEARPAEEDEDLDQRMDLVIRAVSMGRALRTSHGLKVRQPLRAIHLVTRDPWARRTLEEFAEQIRDELNVKAVHFDEREAELVDFVVKANFKSLGPRLGKEVQKAARAIAALPLAEVLALESGRSTTVVVDGVEVTLGPEDVAIERHEKSGLFVECSGSLTVALDKELTPELLEEGLAREFVNRVQGLRKEAGLQVTERIRILYHSAAPEVGRAVAVHGDGIRVETQALELLALPQADGAPVDLNGHPVHIRIEKIETAA